jgi:Na+-translocating ferredoxin:NAD+ oxidoreductase RnfG subunit
MKELTKKILRSAGILAAIGAVGGLVITGVNAVTSPIITKKQRRKSGSDL